jgi:hypothetical protein
VDAYHNGFVLRSLFRINRLAPSKELFATMEKGLRAYLAAFLGPNGETWVYPDSKVVDIHGCAETILCLGRLQSLFPWCREPWERALRWAVQNMQDPATGRFFYQKRKLFGAIDHTVRTPFIRWSDAWMFKALAEARVVLDRSTVDW